MEQFSLEKWLQDKSHKVVTRDGRPVRIVCWDRNTVYWKIIGLVISPDGSTENPFYYDVDGNEADGCLHGNRNDLFFADEEEELTEFEKAVDNIINYPHFQDEQAVKQFSKTLLDLARKELQPEFDKELEKAYKTQDDVVYRNGYAQGKKDALKAALESLPKWRKSDDNLPYPYIGGICKEFLVKKGYYIKISDLETLPKE